MSGYIFLQHDFMASKKNAAFGLHSMFRKAKICLTLFDMLLHMDVVFVQFGFIWQETQTHKTQKVSQQKDTGHAATGVFIFSCAHKT